jgi:outer membrane lipoprotein SlyB
MISGSAVNLSRVAIAAAGFLLLGGCVNDSLVEPSPPPPTVPALPDTQVYVYPAAGQSPEQLDRDKYECHQWAVQETGFDPSDAQVAPHARVRVVAEPAPGVDTLNGAATGAIIGAVVSGPRSTGAGAVVGAIAGALFGAASDQARQQQAADTQARIDSNNDSRWAYGQEQRATSYRRAVSACLTGRNYTVK